MLANFSGKLFQHATDYSIEQAMAFLLKGNPQWLSIKNSQTQLRTCA